MSDEAPSVPIKSGDHVILVDGSSYIFRAYHALPPLTRTSDGLPVGAIAGFCNMLWKLLRDADGGEKPTHIAVVFDYSGRSFRNDIYPEYKAHRPEPPEDLVPQFGLIRDAVKAFNVAGVEQEGFEADDLIATYAREAAEKGANVTIVASDKDLMQLVGPKVSMLDTMKSRVIGEAEVAERFGVPPEKVVEVQALSGDSTDNIPGVPGIGVKTAAQLIAEYGDLETLLARAGEIKQPKRRQSLIEFAEQARVSRRLAELKQDVPLETPLPELAVRTVDPARLIAFCKAMEFNTLTRRVAEATGADPADIEADAKLAAGSKSSKVAVAAAAPEPVAKPAAKTARKGVENTPQALVTTRRAEAASQPVDNTAYETVATVEQLDAWIAEGFEAGLIAVDTETTSLDAMQADLVGVSLALAPGRACYVPLGHRKGDGLDLDGDGGPLQQIPLKEALARLKPLLENEAVLKVGQNLKYDWLVLARHGIEIKPYDDTMLLSYVLDAGRNGHGMDELSQIHLGHTPIAFKDVAGTGKARVTFDLVAIDAATAYAAEDADVTLRLYRVLKPRLAAESMTTVYETLERPMVATLARMERDGVRIERQMLARLSGEFAQKLSSIEAELEKLAGEPFNPGSPKQIGDILFGKMGLEGAKKTKTGAWATGAGVLEDLAAQGHPLPQRLLDWRQLSKLKSTYTDTLPAHIDPETGRVHTSYALASTTTGRLSSSDPNLQNIPARTEEGRRIRSAFVAEKGHKLISADYSQIELRVLAHWADIAALKKAFADGLDIHAMTASEMFGVPVEGMDPQVRRRAKAINFGIIYGISAFGLAAQLGIPRGEAAEYIKTYFERFPGIRDYVEETKAFCRKHGFVATLFGRKAHYPEINTKNPQMRAFMERAAINAPLQGSAADIIRRAMIRMPAALEKAKLKARMLMQVHDELVFEAPEDEVEKTIDLAKKIMEEAPEPAIKLSVPLIVDAHAAANWEEAH
ncbi:MAG: DNA polymerase I [Hyphomicrobiales bacterium]|nr:DNA polymerase I [Hyphomicrobiales bacterium]